MTITTYSKGPTEKLDYVYDFADLLQTGETIVAGTTDAVTVDAGLTLDSSTDTTTTITAWLSGGTVGERYTVAYKAITNSTPARTIVRHIRVEIEHRG